MSPSRRDLRNGLLSLIVLGLAGFGLAQVKPDWLRAPAHDVWPFLTVALALSLLVLLMTLFAVGLVKFFRLLFRPEGGSGAGARTAPRPAPAKPPR